LSVVEVAVVEVVVVVLDLLQLETVCPHQDQEQMVAQVNSVVTEAVVMVDSQRLVWRQQQV
jgi:hypothetical protein